MNLEGQKEGFTQSWEKLVSDGEGLFGIEPESFTPVGIRTNVKETGTLYHGTKAALKAGGLL